MKFPGPGATLTNTPTSVYELIDFELRQTCVVLSDLPLEELIRRHERAPGLCSRVLSWLSPSWDPPRSRPFPRRLASFDSEENAVRFFLRHISRLSERWKVVPCSIDLSRRHRHYPALS